MAVKQLAAKQQAALLDWLIDQGHRPVGTAWGQVAPAVELRPKTVYSSARAMLQDWSLSTLLTDVEPGSLST